jgi:hypothetical protein
MSDHDPTAEVLAGMNAADTLIREHGLSVDRINVQPGAPTAFRRNPATGEWNLPTLPTIEVMMFGQPLAFLAWCRAIHAERVRVKRRDLDTCMWTHVDMDGFNWRLAGDVRRPDSGAHLPGITPDWERQRSGRRGDEAWISVDELDATVALLTAHEIGRQAWVARTVAALAGVEGGDKR